MPVTKPATSPDASATSSDSSGLQPFRMSMMLTAPPVANEPSTLRSARSRMRNVQ